MKKPIIDLGARTGAMNRAHRSLGTGHFRINAATDTSPAEVLIYGEVGGWWDGIQADQMIKDLAAIDADEIDLRVNSPGGAVFDGLAIYNALAQHKATVTVHIEGLAASIASVIAMAGDVINIGESATMMIHPPWTVAVGGAKEFRDEADILDKLQAGICAVYTARSGRPTDEIQPLVEAETWMRGQEAVDNGFADNMIPNKTKKKARSNAMNMPLLRLFQHTPADLLADDDGEPAVRQFEKLLRDGESFSDPDAKRIASLANRLFGPRRDVLEPAPRDEENREARRAELNALADHIRSLI